MELVYTNTVEDLVNFQLYHYDHDKGLQRLQTLLMLIPAIIVVVFVFLQSQRGGALLPGLVGLVLAVVLALGMRRFMRQRMEREARRAYAQGRGKRTLGQHRLALTAEGLVESAGSQTFTTPWDAITQVVETAEAIYVYCGRTAGMVIPRARVRKGDLEAFLTAVRARMGTPSQSRPDQS